MKKSFLLGSSIVAVALFSGCGGSGGSSDTTPPSFTNTTYSFDVNEGVDKSVSLTANEEVSFTEDSAEATINGTNLVFSAPNYNSAGVNVYKVKVAAEDKAGNHKVKEFTFNVKAVVSGNYKFDSSYIAPVGDKSFTNVDGRLKDTSGLLWDDEVSESMSYDAAKTYCQAKGTGWRMPTRAEFLNIVDYSKVATVGTDGSLIDGDFSHYSADSVTVSWVENLATDKYVVQHTGGADTTIGNDMNHTVLCVYGDKNSTAHTFTQVGSDFKDNVTDLTWKVINASNNPSTYTDANIGCNSNGTDWSLPTINELRSIVNYNTNTIPTIATGTPTNQHTYFIWSKTVAKDINGSSAHYTIYLDGTSTKAGVIHDKDSETHYYTCVKR